MSAIMKARLDKLADQAMICKALDLMEIKYKQERGEIYIPGSEVGMPDHHRMSLRKDDAGYHFAYDSDFQHGIDAKVGGKFETQLNRHYAAASARDTLESQGYYGVTVEKTPDEIRVYATAD